MNVRHLLASTALAASLALGATASSATVLNLGNSNPFQIKFSDYESFTGTGTLSTGNSNFGIISVTSITNSNGINVWTQGATATPGTNGFIFGVFDQIHVDSVSGGPVNAQGKASGGLIDLYYFTTDPGFDPNQGTGGYGAAGGGCTTNQNCYHTITDVGGELLLQLQLVPGIDGTSPTTTLVSTSTLTTFPFTGQSSGYLNVIGGTDAAQFNTNGFTTALGTIADMFLQENFCVENSAPACVQHGTAANHWALNSQDPVDANIIPEPGSLALLGSALVGLGALFRRRLFNGRNKAAIGAA